MPRTSHNSAARVPGATTNSDSTGHSDALAWLEGLPTRGLPDALGIKVTELTAKRVVATMPVDHRTRQPFGILHGGASVALAETVASLGAVMNIDRERSSAVGVEINANHLRAKSEGTVTATGVPIHVGRSTQVWEIRITDESGNMVCISRCTLAVVPANVGTRQAST